MANALREARRRERLSQAQWRRQRAEVARLIAAGEEAAARALLDQAGVSISKETELWEASPGADNGSPAAAANKSVSGSGDPACKKARHAKPRRDPKGKAGQTAQANKPTPTPKRKAPRPITQPSHAKPVKAASRTQRGTTTTWAVWLSERPPWVTSLATHGVLIGLFGLLTFGTLGDPGFSLTASLDDADAWNEMPAEVTLASLELDAGVAESVNQSLETPIELSAGVELASLVEPASLEPVTALGDFSSLSAASLMTAVPTGGGSGDSAAESSGASGGGRSGGGKSGRVSFFGAESKAERVIFVVDNSGSMQRGRMETTLFELERAVHGLATGQEFYVLFFSDQAYPMFFPQPAEAAVRATQPNKQRLSAWLRTVETCLGGRLLDAMELAAGLEPDVVYLLTDGDIRSSRIIGALTAKDRWPFAIHTLAMGARTQRHVALLQAVAQNTGGTYRPVAANPAAVARSRLRPIPYHRQPGEVWGSAVQSWD